MEYFVVGDVHGCFDKLKLLLETHWKKEREQLIILGDLIDRGPRSREVIQLAMSLRKEYKAIILKGNHEDLFLDWLEDPLEMSYYYDIGGRETVDSFFDERVTFQKDPLLLTESIRIRYKEEMGFLKSLPNYHEADGFIFVHAGVNLDFKDWKNTNDNDFKWIRHEFIYRKNETEKTIVFGHTGTRKLNADKSDDVWFSPCGTKIGIDGSCGDEGVLHGLRITNGKISIRTV